MIKSPVNAKVVQLCPVSLSPFGGLNVERTLALLLDALWLSTLPLVVLESRRRQVFFLLRFVALL